MEKIINIGEQRERNRTDQNLLVEEMISIKIVEISIGFDLSGQHVELSIE